MKGHSIYTQRGFGGEAVRGHSVPRSGGGCRWGPRWEPRGRRTSRRAGWSGGSREALSGSSTSRAARASPRRVALERRRPRPGRRVTSLTLTADCGTRSSTSRELHRDRVRVVAEVGPPGSGRLVDGEVAAGQQHAPSTAAPPSDAAVAAPHRATSTSPPRVGSTSLGRARVPGRARTAPARRQRQLPDRRRRAHRRGPAWLGERAQERAGSVSSWPMFSPRLRRVSSVPACGL